MFVYQVVHSIQYSLYVLLEVFVMCDIIILFECIICTLKEYYCNKIKEIWQMYVLVKCISIVSITFPWLDLL